MIRHVLVPVDFSRLCAAAAPYAVALADRFEAALTFTHVIPGLPYEGTEEEAFYGPRGEVVSGRELDNYYRDRLDRFVAEAAPSKETTNVLLKGDVSARLEEHARTNAVDLVVMPTRGYGPFRRLLIGSVAARILHDLSCPVFTSAHVAEPPEGSPRFERVSCAVDLGPSSEAVLTWARDFSRAWKAELTVIYAAPQVEFDVDSKHFIKDDWHSKLVGAARDGLDALIERVGCEARVNVEVGHSVHSVTAGARDSAADVLIIGRGRAADTSSRLATDAYGIVRESPCPVISI